MKNFAIFIAAASLILNVILWNKSHDLDLEKQRRAIAEKECAKEIQSIERDFQQQLNYYNMMETEWKDRKKELELEVDKLVGQKDKLTEEKTRYFGEKIGLEASLEQLKQILASQGRFEHYIEENFEMKGKLAEVQAILNIEQKKNADLQQELARKRDMISQMNDKLAQSAKNVFELQSTVEAYKADFEGLVLRNRNLMQSFKHDVEEMLRAFTGTNEKGSKRSREDAQRKAQRLYHEILQKYANASNYMGNPGPNVSRVSYGY